MIFNINKTTIFLFLQQFVGFGCALVTVTYIMEGKISYIKIILIALLFSVTLTYRRIKKDKISSKT
jgi:hypothetical protein